MRYGSLTRFDQPRRRWCEIVKLTGIHYNTCMELVRRFHEHGNEFVKVKAPGRPRWPIPEDVQQFIKDSLVDQRFLPLRQRCEQIKRRFGLVFTKDRLWKTYRRMGITHGPCKTVMKAATRNEARLD